MQSILFHSRKSSIPFPVRRRKIWAATKKSQHWKKWSMRQIRSAYLPSGIPDFRSADGIYNEKIHGYYTPEQIISHTIFMRETALFYDFYKSKMLYPDAKPNNAHIYFAELEKKRKTGKRYNPEYRRAASGGGQHRCCWAPRKRSQKLLYGLR